ncbi:MAG: ACP phosphodiesterase [Vicingaceae bacterium]
MNYLAHFYLAHGDEGLIVGNFLADYIRGKKYLEYPEHVQRGVLQHRGIDEFTDTHAIVELTKARLRGKYRKYTPVISDVFYDFALGNNWGDYSDLDLKAFAREIYEVLHDNAQHLPEKAQLTLAYMSKNDWLYHYSTFWGIEKALQGLSHRANFDNDMNLAIADLKKDVDKVESEFRDFFPELQTFANTFKE